MRKGLSMKTNDFRPGKPAEQFDMRRLDHLGRSLHAVLTRPLAQRRADDLTFGI